MSSIDESFHLRGIQRIGQVLIYLIFASWTPCIQMHITYGRIELIFRLYFCINSHTHTFAFNHGARICIHTSILCIAQACMPQTCNINILVYRCCFFIRISYLFLMSSFSSLPFLRLFISDFIFIFIYDLFYGSKKKKHVQIV